MSFRLVPARAAGFPIDVIFPGESEPDPGGRVDIGPCASPFYLRA